MENQRQDAFTVDVRTRRPARGGQSSVESSPRKPNEELEHTKRLFRELVRTQAYIKLKGLAYAMCTSYAVPGDISQLIRWSFAAAARNFLDMYFLRVEALGKDVPAEERAVVDKVRPSFFGSVNTDEI
jgi:hypothetical protein